MSDAIRKFTLTKAQVAQLDRLAACKVDFPVIGERDGIPAPVTSEVGARIDAAAVAGDEGTDGVPSS